MRPNHVWHRVLLQLLLGVMNANASADVGRSSARDAVSEVSQVSSAATTGMGAPEPNPYPITLSLKVLRPELAYNIGRGSDAAEEPKKIGDRTFNSMRFVSQALNAVGVSASWNGYGASYSQKVGSLADKITKEYVDYTFDGHFESWGFSAYHQQCEGAVQLLTENEKRQSTLSSSGNSSSQTGGSSSGTDPDGNDDAPWSYTVDSSFPAPDTKMVHQGFNLYGSLYRTSFSFANAFEVSDLNVQSGISVPWVVSYSFEEFDGTVPIVPEKYAHLFELSNDIVDVHSTTYALGSGFAGARSMNKFFISGMILVGVGYAKTEYRSASATETIPRATLKSTIRFNAGLNFRRAFVIAELFMDGNQQDINGLNITSQNTQMSVTAALRM